MFMIKINFIWFSHKFYAKNVADILHGSFDDEKTVYTMYIPLRKPEFYITVLKKL